jgi:hypothetical protein
VTRFVYEKVAQSLAQTFICQNKYITGTVEKDGPKICATSLIFKPLPKVKNRPIGENSPNLVTLN